MTSLKLERDMTGSVPPVLISKEKVQQGIGGAIVMLLAQFDYGDTPIVYPHSLALRDLARAESWAGRSLSLRGNRCNGTGPRSLDINR